jgi:hypothetical protein
MIAAEVSDLRDSFSSAARSQRSRSLSSGFALAWRTCRRTCGGLPRISVSITYSSPIRRNASVVNADGLASWRS